MVESIEVEGGGGGEMLLTVTLDAAALIDGANPAQAVGSTVIAQCAATADAANVQVMLEWEVAAARYSGVVVEGRRQGLTLVHLSAQPQPFLTQMHPKCPLINPDTS
jgi:hypothetical protein